MLRALGGLEAAPPDQDSEVEELQQTLLHHSWTDVHQLSELY